MKLLSVKEFDTLGVTGQIVAILFVIVLLFCIIKKNSK